MSADLHTVIDLQAERVKPTVFFSLQGQFENKVITHDQLVTGQQVK